ncbi:VirB4 family type IV secretion/conjugal transfer ATPase [Photobacterium carnosum]|uniref:VirB4 family type IV secretion/conjugal transfer ATPase n=1 Tax=Photobacterium carnosum TaxID=2023717 RepID=UPI001E51A4DB|nr:VirB4 family type IV secretion/conjugal transfer ATPase [Photobacterium carnosum]MCD9538973.1 VirB4 family type IV secretion/conjugal transfer ATPase [Photobacterium carnosum]MCF2163673.1 VirB4 family type IV secretion/conjugal transfer ATPase [Photobacterium carnosum]MCF2307917.1 VirB4 family type IV secretion/conjugal transfer ATPase [Photobacterium carnosum]
MAQTKHVVAMKKANTSAPFIPFSTHVNDELLMSREGHYLAVFELQGSPFETKGIEDLQQEHQSLNTLLKGFSEQGLSFWVHLVRRKEPMTMDGEYSQSICQQINNDYATLFEADALINRYYLTVVYKPSLGNLSQTGLAKWLGLGSVMNKAEIVQAKTRVVKNIEFMMTLTTQLQHRLSLYSPRLLRCYSSSHSTHRLSEPLQLYHYLMTGVWKTVPVFNDVISNGLSASLIDIEIAIGRETIELRGHEQSRYLQGIEINDYPNLSETGMFNGLLYCPYELIVTQSLRLIPKKLGIGVLKKHKRHLKNVKDDGATQVEGIGDAIEELVNGNYAVAEYHFSCFVFGDSINEAKQHRIHAQGVLEEQDLTVTTISIALDAAFYAQLPSNFVYRPRVVVITTRNFSAFCSMNNFVLGKAMNNDWGAAVTQFSTLGGCPFYFNFHASRLQDDAQDKRNLGNTTIIGKSGTGKSVLMSLLMAQAQKFGTDEPFNMVVFDKDRGLEAMVRALGGSYSQVKKGIPTGFNPFALEPTPSNCVFLKSLTRRLLQPSQGALTDLDIEKIDNAVEDVMAMPIELRRIAKLASFLTTGNSQTDKANSLRRRLARWCRGGEFGWVFDNADDVVNFGDRWIVGIDGTELLEMDDDIKTPISLYLLHRMDDVIDGRRFIYWMDEAWKWVNDAAFSEFVGNKQVTIRKQNGLGVFSTQMPKQIIRSKVGMELTHSCATEIYLPNKKGTREEYIDHFKLTEKEFSLLKDMDENSRLCLIKQGETSVICQLNLPPAMAKWLPILSISTDQLPLLDKALERHGDHPEAWIPAYLASINEGHHYE